MDEILDIDPERKGFLTKSMRDYLNGKKDDISDDYETSLQGKIRDRVLTAFLEFQLLESEKLDSKQRKYIFNQGRSDSEHSSVRVSQHSQLDNDEFLKTGPQALPLGFFSIFKFYYKTLREAGQSRENEFNWLSEAIKEAEQEYIEGHREVEVTIEIESVEEVDIESAKERYEEEGILGVSGVEMKALAEVGYLSASNPDE